MNEEILQYEKWEEDLLNSIKSFTPSDEMLNQFQKNVSDILTTNKLLPPIDEQTLSFVEDFCPKLISFILASHPPADKSPVLNSFLLTLIPLYSKYLIDNNRNEKFIKTAKMIIFDSKSQFYKFTTQTNKEGSQYYFENIQKFIESGVIEKATEFLNENENVEVSKILLFISNFHPFQSLFPKKSLTEFYSVASIKLQKKIHLIGDNDIRSVNEREITQAVKYIHENLSSDSTFSEDIEKLNQEIFLLAIKFVKSPFLSKQYSGLCTIRTQLLDSDESEVKKRKRRKKNESNRSSVHSKSKNDENDDDDEIEKNDLQLKLCRILDDEKIISFLLRSLHHTLINDFLFIFKIMLQYNLITSNNLKEFWNLTLKQHQTTIDVFINAIEDLMNFLNEKFTNELWEIFSKSEKFPVQILLFFQRIASNGSGSNRTLLYKSLIDYYKKNEFENSEEKNVLINTLCVLLPENEKICNELRNQCFETIENENDYDFSLSLLRASCKSMTPEKAHESFSKLLKIIKGIQNVSILKFLNPLKEMILHLDDSFTDDEFNELLQITTTLLVDKNQDEIIDFYKTIFQVQNQRKGSNISLKSTNNSDSSSEEDSIDEIENEEEDEDSDNKSTKTKKEKNKRKSSASESKKLTKNSLLNHDRIITIIQKVSEIDPPPFDFIIILFEEVNKRHFSILSSSSLNNNNNNETEKITKSAESLHGIDLIWNINFKYDEIMQVSNYLCNLYAKSQNTADIKEYLKKCLKHTDKLSSFITIRLMMDALEWTFDKLSRNIEENKFYTKLDCYEIHIIGYSKETIRIPKLYQFDAFCERIACILDLKRKDISVYFIQNPQLVITQKQEGQQKNSDFIEFYISEGIEESSNNNNNDCICINNKDAIFITHDNYSSLVKNNITIGVNALSNASKLSSSKKFRVSFAKEFSTSYFPSLYLSKPKHFSLLFDFVKHNHSNKFARIALDIVNRLPSDEKELLIIRSDTEKKPNWKKHFTLKNNHWCIFLYRLNIIGSLLLKGGEWIDGFYMSGGSLWLLNILFNNALIYFTSNEDLQLILEIASLLLKNIESKKLKKKMISSLGKEALEKVITLALQYKDTSSILKTLYGIIFEFADVLPNVFISIKSFIQLFDFSIFHKNKTIRESIEKVVNLISPKVFLKPIIKQLPKANNFYCDEYFSLMNEVAQTYSNQLLNTMIETLFNKYEMNEKANLIDQLYFTPPNEKFTHGFFNVFDIVIANNGNSSKNDIFSFIVENILFNRYKYYNPNQNLFNILNYFLKKDQNLVNLIISKTFIENKDINLSAPIGHFTFVKHRGIKNLGATCYMNATIQALFNVHRFRYLILKKYTKSVIRDMKKQYLNLVDSNDYYSDSYESEEDNKNELQRKNNYDSYSIDLNNANNDDIDEEVTIRADFPVWLKNFRLIMAKLLFFPTDFIDISDFVKSWKWYDEPVNFRMQQDAAEFIQMFLNRLAEQIPTAADLFQGEICHEIVGTNYNFSNQIKEKFVIFPLEVNGNSSVEDSFKAFLMPDVFEGDDQYLVEEIGKINAKRFHWISKAPQILILQLKRFSFNMKTGKREKLNNEYSFPFLLNLKTIMKPINKINDSLIEEEEEETSNSNQNTNDDCLYDLIAVEMHTGDSDGGHYFSFCGPPCTSKDKMEEWYKFDDTKAVKINAKKIPDIAKGNSSSSKTSIDFNQSAYLLFYQKRTSKYEEQNIKKIQNDFEIEEEEKSDNETENNKLNSNSENSNISSLTNSSLFTESSVMAINKEINNSSINFNILSNKNNSNNEEEDINDEDEFITDSQFEPIHHKIDNEIVKNVANDVENLVKYSVIKNTDYSHFLMSIASNSNDLNFVYEFLMSFLKNTKEKDKIISIFNKLKEIMNPEISIRFLSEKTSIYNDFLVKNEDREIRKICCDVVISAVNHSNGQFDSYLQFIENYLPRSISNWTRFDEFVLPLVYIIEKKSDSIDKKKWATILMNFLGNSLKSANNDQICLLIKLDTIYRCLILLFEDSSIRKEFESNIFNIEFLKPLFISRRNSKSLASLIRNFIASPSNSKEENELKRNLFFSLVNKFIFENENEIKVICGVFSTFLFFDNANHSMNNSNSKAAKERQAIIEKRHSEDENESEYDNDDDDDDEYEMSNMEEFSLSFIDFDNNIQNANEIIESVLTILKGSSNEENEPFLCELILRIPYIQYRLIPFLTNNDNFWIIHWLFNVDLKIRNECCELLYKVFNEFPRLTFIDDNNGNKEEEEFYDEKSQKMNHQAFAKQSLKQIAASMYSFTKKFVEYSISRLKNSYQLHCRGVDTFRMLPYRNFFELLRWSIVRTDSASIILKKPKLLVNGMVKFKKVEKVNSDLCFSALKFIHSVIGIKHAKQFFKKRRFARKFVKVFSNATFDSINRYTSIETVSMIITLLPHHYSKYLFETKFFNNSLEYCFSAISVTAPQLENYIIANAKLKKFAPLFWSDSVFGRNYRDSNYYLSLTANLLTMKQKLSNLFFDLGRPKQIMRSIVVVGSSSSNFNLNSSVDNHKKSENSTHFSFRHHNSKQNTKKKKESNIKISDTTSNNLIEEFTSVSAKQIEVLVAFLRAYQQYGKKPRSLVKLMIGLREEIKKMLDISLMNNGNNVRTDVLLAIYKILMQLFVMGPEFEQIVLNYVRNGLLASSRDDVWSGAIELIRYICVILNANQKESTAYNLALNELLSLKKPYNFRIVVELCDIITTPLFLYEPPVDGIVEFLNKIRNDGEMPDPVPKEIKKLILTLRDKEAKGISKLVEFVGAQC